MARTLPEQHHLQVQSLDGEEITRSSRNSRFRVSIAQALLGAAGAAGAAGAYGLDGRDIIRSSISCKRRVTDIARGSHGSRESRWHRHYPESNSSSGVEFILSAKLLFSWSQLQSRDESCCNWLQNLGCMRLPFPQDMPTFDRYRILSKTRVNGCEEQQHVPASVWLKNSFLFLCFSRSMDLNIILFRQA